MGFRVAPAPLRVELGLSGVDGRVARDAAQTRALTDVNEVRRSSVICHSERSEESLLRIRLGRAAASALLLGIRFYQIALSPLNLAACKFYPSCSHYAVEAISTHGAWNGFRLALARLWRCRPFARGGFDPVPETLEAHECDEKGTHSGARA
jgi:uncharacterized protein